MDEYISREEVINITAETGAWETQNRVRELPAADVQPVKHGRWLYRIQKDSTTVGQHGVTYCSECRYVIFTKADKYCAKCGAKMDLKDNEVI